MANRVAAMGMDKELVAKAAAKYDSQMEVDARKWIEAVTGTSLGEGSLQEALKSGAVLCELVNKVEPGCCKAPSKMAAPFKQMENIGNYLAACAKLGQRTNDSFQTVALYEGQDMMAVLIQIHSLGRIAQQKGFKGPTLGAKIAEKNERSFTEQQLREAAGTATFLGKGSHGTPGSQMERSELLGANIDKTLTVKGMGGVNDLGQGSEQTFLAGGGVKGLPNSGADFDTTRPGVGGADATPTPPPPTPPVPMAEAPRAAPDSPATSSFAGSYSAASAAADMPSAAKSTYVSAEQREAECGGKLLYGLDKELAEKAAAKYDSQMEVDARKWIEAVTGTSLGEGSLQEALKSGAVLCELANKVEPGCCKAPSKMAAPFKQMENIGNYLAACAKLGQSTNDSFQTIALYEGQDMMAVLIQIHSLGRIAQQKGFKGPTLGAKLAHANHRNFTEEQLKEAQNVPTFLGKGSHGTEGGNMSKLQTGKTYAKNDNIAGLEGLGLGGEATLVGKGTTGTAGAAMSRLDHGKQVDRNANVHGDLGGLGTGGEATVPTGSMAVLA